ncbi:protein SPMIP1-like [Osmerus mordax]|uniref:protein SPMIP1-like n=1 Tax=Osmerus mordax TaxID=8014 RepID=UPI00350FF24E
MDSHIQGFWRESILKENMLRLNWFRDNWTKYHNTPKKVSAKARATLPQIAKPPHEGTPSLPTVKDRGQENNCNQTILPMRPVSGETRKVLYDGFSKEQTGRYKYLLMRKAKSPEEKYPYPLTSNCEYGWGLGDTTKAYVPMFALNAIVRDTFYRKNGTFPHSTLSDRLA